MLNKTINGYTIKCPLGEGGMAEVWYSENGIGNPAAIKFLKKKFCEDETVVDRFRNEAMVMVKLGHPYIRRVYDYMTVDGLPCIIMEYLEGDDLKARLVKGERFSDDRLKKWWGQLADALNYTHQQGVIHRDIKPSNIFIDKYDNVKLMDFGIAKIEESGGHTQTGVAMGTRVYMSPEQVRDPKRVKAATDSYSLAVTFVHLLTGKVPYDTTNSSDFDIQTAIVQEPLDLSALSDEWQSFLRPYLAKKPEERPALQHFSQTETEKDIYSHSSRIFSPTMIHSDEETLVENKGAGNSKTNGHSPLVKDQAFDINGASFMMKYVEGGTFQMGATSEQESDAYDDEKPVHEVTLSEFYIGETEVTQGLWKAVMGDNPSYFKGDDLPVEHVSWDDCWKFIQKLNALMGKTFQLPTEAQWEFAARGGNLSNGYKYSGNSNINEVGWFDSSSGNKTHPVKMKLPNELGLYDMSGNVWEWCQDWYGFYSSSSKTNPAGPSSGCDRVLRGGSWFNYARRCRVSVRRNHFPSHRGNRCGFRLALSC